MDSEFDTSLSQVLSRVLARTAPKEVYGANTPNRRLEGIVGGRQERRLIERIGLLLDTRGLPGVTVWQEACISMDKWLSRHSRDVGQRCELSSGILSEQGISFDRRGLRPGGFRQVAESGAPPIPDTRGMAWGDALRRFFTPAHAGRLDLLIVGFPHYDAPQGEDDANDLKRHMHPLRERIVWLVGSGVFEGLEAVDPTGQSRSLGYPPAATGQRGD